MGITSISAAIEDIRIADIRKRSGPKMEQHKNRHQRYSIMEAFSRKRDEAELEEYRRCPEVVARRSHSPGREANPKLPEGKQD